MAKKPRTRRDRIISLCGWTFVLLAAVINTAWGHGGVRFLSLLQIAVTSMLVLYEIKGLLEEPS